METRPEPKKAPEVQFLRTGRVTVGIEERPYHELEFLDAASGKKSSGSMRARLPFLRGEVTGLPAGFPAIIATGDLQGRSDFGDADETLLGCDVSDKLPALHHDAGLPNPGECLGLMAGDFFTVPNAAIRGGTGDVTAVWHRMSDVFGQLVGVAGNHDIFGVPGSRQLPFGRASDRSLGSSNRGHFRRGGKPGKGKPKSGKAVCRDAWRASGRETPCFGAPLFAPYRRGQSGFANRHRSNSEVRILRTVGLWPRALGATVKNSGKGRLPERRWSRGDSGAPLG